MPGLLIDLPEDVQKLAASRATLGGFARVDEYLKALIVADAAEPISPELEAHLVRVAGLPEREMTHADWDEKRRQLREWHARLKK